MTFIKEKIDFIYQNILLFHFKALSLRILNERLKNTPHPLQFFLKHQLSFRFMYLFQLSQPHPDSFLTSYFSFIIMYARIHTHRRVFPYFFFRPCYTHFILIGRYGYHLLHRFVYHTQNRKVSFFYTIMTDFTRITVNFAFECKFKINY